MVVVIRVSAANSFTEGSVSVATTKLSTIMTIAFAGDGFVSVTETMASVTQSFPKVTKTIVPVT